MTNGEASIVPGRVRKEAREALNTRRPGETTNPSHRGGSADPLPRGPGPGAARVSSGHPEPGAGALLPLPTSVARAPLQSVYVAPGTLSFQLSSVIKRVSQERPASGLSGPWRNQAEVPMGTPTGASWVGTPGLGQLAPSLAAHLQGPGVTPRPLSRNCTKQVSSHSQSSSTWGTIASWEKVKHF